MVKRSGKLAFMKTTNNAKFERMTGFTEFTVNANAKEYSRRYIDEDMERSSVVAYQPTISYKFDYNPEDMVQNMILDVTELEKVGSDTIVTIAIVDTARDMEEGYLTKVRDFYIVPSTEGDDTDNYTFSGTLKAAGPLKIGMAQTSDDFKSITITEI